MTPQRQLPSPDEAPGGFSRLKRQSLKSGTITAFAQAVHAVIQVGSTVILARILSPGEFGVISMVLTITVFAALFRDLGLSASTVQRAEMTHAQLSTAYWLNVSAGAALTIIVAAAAPAVAWFYERPELAPVTLCLAGTFLLGSLGTQPGALMTRQMRFGRKAIATIGGALTNFVVTLTLALQGLSYWSLVWGNLAGAFATSLLLHLLAGWRPGPPARRTGARSMLKFGLNITGFDFVNYFSRNLDNVLIGKYVGADALGLYARAYHLLMFPISNLRGPINAVAFPALSRLQEWPEEFRQYYRLVISVLALVSMPLVGYLFVAAEPIIRLALGPQWMPAAQLFAILAFAAFLQTPSGFRGTVLMSLGLGQRYFRQGLITAIITCAGFAIGIRWGATGVATAYAVTSLILPYPMHVYSFRGTPVSPRDFLGSIAGPAIAAVAAGAICLVLRFHYWQAAPAAVDALASLLAYGTLYVGLLLLRAENRRSLQRARVFLRNARQKRKESIAVPPTTAPAAVVTAPTK